MIDGLNEAVLEFVPVNVIQAAWNETTLEVLVSIGAVGNVLLTAVDLIDLGDNEWVVMPTQVEKAGDFCIVKVGEHFIQVPCSVIRRLPVGSPGYLRPRI
jgi:hypothetical protein